MEVGSKLGRYEIRELIGSGGMGRVYLALDTELDRLVALKVLLPEFVSDAARVKRFFYEAKAVSAINHPGIITIHEIVNHEDKVFIATELVKGHTLRTLIEESKTRDLRQAVSVAEQVADALSVAHHEGIVHRDIKPENVMVRDDGIVKLLDFGLAKPIPSANEVSQQKKEVKTQPGLVIGSVRYMSPEQARGKETDERTDIWSLGVVIYEMLTGENPFDGETVSDQLAAVIHKDPPEVEFENPRISEILRGCLSKDLEGRYANAKVLGNELRALRLELENESGDTESRFGIHRSLDTGDTSENKTLIHQTVSAENRTAIMSAEKQQTTAVSEFVRTKRRWLPLASIAVILIALAGGALLYAYSGGVEDPFRDISVNEMTDDGDSTSAAISPDGKFVAYASKNAGENHLTVHQVATGTDLEIVPETNGRFLQPVFTSDSEFVYYVIARRGVGTLYRIAALGGEPTKIIEDIDSRPALSKDGKTALFYRHDPKDGGDRIISVNTETKESRVIADSKKLGLDGISDVQFGSGEDIAYFVGRKVSKSMRSVISLNAIELATGKLTESSLTREFRDEDWFVIKSLHLHSDDLGLLFIGKRKPEDNQQVWSLNSETGQVRRITKDTNDYVHLSISSDLSRMVVSLSEWNSGLTAIDVSNQNTSELVPFSGRFLGKYGITVSKDGVIVYPKLDREEINLYSLNPASGEEKKLTNGNGVNAFPSFSKDGKRIVFSSTRDDIQGLWTMKADGSEKKRVTSAENMRDVSAAFVEGDSRIAFVRQPVDGSTASLMIVDADGGDTERLLPDSGTSDVDLYVSPDSKMFAFRSVDYDSEKASLNSKIKFGRIENGKAEILEKELDTEIDEWVTWDPDGKSVIRVGAGETQEFVRVPLEGESRDQVVKTPYADVIRFYWNASNKKMLLVRGFVGHDLVMIEDGPEKFGSG